MEKTENDNRLIEALEADNSEKVHEISLLKSMQKQQGRGPPTDNGSGFVFCFVFSFFVRFPCGGLLTGATGTLCRS